MDKAAKKSCPACRESKSNGTKFATSRYGRHSKDANDSPDSDVRRIYLEPPDVMDEDTYNDNLPKKVFLKEMRRAAVQIDNILESDADLAAVQQSMDTLVTAKEHGQDVSEVCLLSPHLISSPTPLNRRPKISSCIQSMN
jgi:hypothetical protein